MKTIEFYITAQDFHDQDTFFKHLHSYGLNIDYDKYVIIKKSIDLRKFELVYWLKVGLLKSFETFEKYEPHYINVTNNKQVLIIGAGPAGLFAALQLINKGIKPIIIEQGSNVRDRRRDLAAINKQGIVNPLSNYSFGEGGAGTYSDGKLYTRSNKRGNVSQVLDTFVFFGAEPAITFEAHPHIGTNKLPKIIENIRNFIISCGGEIHFNNQAIDFEIGNKSVTIKTQLNTKHKGCALILASGHSSSSIYQLLQAKQFNIESKPFAVGFRWEHPQDIINKWIYKHKYNNPYLPPASYSIVEKAFDRSIYSFCMCPGGIIAPCATTNHQVVTNGWSPSKRNNPYANAGLVVQVNEQDFEPYKDKGPLAALYFQNKIETLAYDYGPGNQKAPAQNLSDFLSNKPSNYLNSNSYLPGTYAADFKYIFPELVFKNLKSGLNQILKKYPILNSEQAILLGPESRTSSPIRIPRLKTEFHHPQSNLIYPCGEGAGYAGGIVSAAIDGINSADAVFKNIFKN